MIVTKQKTSSVGLSSSANQPFFHKKGVESFFGHGDQVPHSFFGSASTYSLNGKGIVQTSLVVDQPNDTYEKEADAMADKVIMRMSDPPAFGNGRSGTIQRKCTECIGDDEQKLQPKSETSGLPSATPCIARSLNASKGSGSPLPAAIRKQMESSFGADFSPVRLHTNSSAVQMNKDLNAKAFTHGNDIYFDAGKYDTNSTRGKHLLAHELTHVLQQKHGPGLLQRAPKNETNVSVETCLKQNDGDLLPGRVGVVEHINREVILNEILGKERIKFENQIRQDYDARNFVCEAGITAILALYYNRDYRNRLFVRRARESFTSNPEYYSHSGISATRQTKDMLKKKYNIFIERGDKDWSPEDIGLLAEALGKLTENEIPLISNYHFIRWTNECNQLEAKNPEYKCEYPEDYDQCGLHEVDIVDRKYTITMYDCMKGSSKPDYNVKPGADTIIHEIGHAMEYGRLRLALEDATDAKKEYNRIKRQYDKATTAAAKMSINKQLTAVKKIQDDADMKVNNLLTTPVLTEFEKLIKGKSPLTPYAATNLKEAFAEAFMLFKVAPEKLRKLNKPLFNWFSKGGFL